MVTPQEIPPGLVWKTDHWMGPVLAVRASSLGDVLIALGAVHLLKKKRPDLEIDFLTRPAFAELVLLSSSIRHLLLPDPDKNTVSDNYEFLWDLQGGTKGRRIARGYSWKDRVGFRSHSLHRRAMVLTGRRIKRPPHLLQRFLQPVADWSPQNRGWEFAIGPTLDRIDFPKDVNEGRRIGLVPHARYPLKECPLRTYIECSKRLVEEGYEPVWFWDPERSPSVEIHERAGHQVIQAPLKEVAWELARCRVVIAGDTGLAHLASAVGRPVVSVFGSTVPELGYTPIGRHSIVEVDLSCRPCHVHGAKRCWMGHRLCVEKIDSEILIQHVKALA